MPIKREIIQYLEHHNINYNKCISFLKNQCKIEKGFEAQVVGNKLPSATTTGLITYTLSTLGEIDSSFSDVLNKDISSFRIKKTGSFIDSNDGAYDTLTFGTHSYASVWATSQALLGLVSLKKVTKAELNATVKWLLDRQKHGGWSFTGTGIEKNRLIYSIYPILSLKKYYDQYGDSTILSVFEKTIDYAVRCRPNSELDKIIKNWIIYYLNDLLDRSDEFIRFQTIDFMKIIDYEFSESLVYEHSVSPFSMQYFTPSFYLLMRNHLDPDHPFCFYIIKYLISNQIKQESWSHTAKDRLNKPYSFCTALSLLTLYYWAYDSLKKSKQVSQLPSLESLRHQINNICRKPPKIFISYSKKDEYIAKQISEKLKFNRYEVWFDEWEIKIGDSIVEKICNGIVESDFLILLLSKNSINSTFVKYELNRAKRMEILKNKVIILPVIIDNIDDTEIPSVISDKRYADIRNSFDKGLNDILNAIGDF